jgi:hypothetical protein
MSKFVYIVFYHLFCQNKSDMPNRAGSWPQHLSTPKPDAIDFDQVCRIKKNLLVKGFSLIVNIRN